MGIAGSRFSNRAAYANQPARRVAALRAGFFFGDSSNEPETFGFIRSLR